MKALLKQFKTLNPRDPSVWPLLPRLLLAGLAFGTILLAAYYADWEGQLVELDEGRVKEAKLKDEYVAKAKQAINLDLYKQQLADIDLSFGELLRQLPDRSQMEGLITDINQAGATRGLQFDLFRPAPAETKREFYAELPITIRVVGEYHQMGQFAAAIGQLPRIVTLNDVNLTVSREGVLVMDATAKTFRYLDDEELAESRRATKPKAGAAK